MSVLNLPRIHFSGEMLWNPDTCNNSPGVYNEDTLETTGTENGHPVPHDQYVKWLGEQSTSVPVGQQALNGSWNVFGDASWWFDTVQATGVQYDPGQEPQGDLICDNPFSQVQIIGQGFAQDSIGRARMVDVAPYQSTTTQLFYKWFQLGTEDCGFKAVGACRMYLRWSMFRNLLGTQLPIAGLAGVTFQTAAKAHDIDWYGLDRSNALRQLKAQAEAAPNQGVAIQFAAYFTQYYKNAEYNNKKISSPQELADAYAAGFTGFNPAQSKVTGSIGVWGQNELASAPTQLLLKPAEPVSAPAIPLPSSRAAQEGTIAVEAAAAQAMPLGPAMAQVTDPRTLSVSFLSTILETNRNLDKEDLGTLVLQVEDSTIARIPYACDRDPESGYLTGYDKNAYEMTSGILDFPITPEQFQMIRSGGTIRLIVPEQGVMALQQDAWVVESDQRGEYLDEGEEKSMTVCVYKNGRPAESGRLLVAQYYEEINWADPNSSSMNYLLATSSSQSVVSMNGDTAPKIAVPVQNGKATFKIAPLKAGQVMLGFFPFEDAEPSLPDSSTPFPYGATSYYATVRCLGWDNHLIGTSADWVSVRDEVLELYNLVYPAMSQVFPLTDEDTVNQMAQKILTVTDLGSFDWTLFMPVSREMSAGKRWLLRRYCESVPPPDTGPGGKN